MPAPAQDVATDSLCRVFVGSIPGTVSDNELRDVLERYGRITACHYAPAASRSTFRGWALVTFASREDAAAVIAGVNGRMLFPDCRVPIAARIAYERRDQNDHIADRDGWRGAEENPAHGMNAPPPAHRAGSRYHDDYGRRGGGKYGGPPMHSRGMNRRSGGGGYRSRSPAQVRSPYVEGPPGMSGMSSTRDYSYQGSAGPSPPNVHGSSHVVGHSSASSHPHPHHHHHQPHHNQHHPPQPHNSSFNSYERPRGNNGNVSSAAALSQPNRYNSGPPSRHGPPYSNYHHSRHASMDPPPPSVTASGPLHHSNYRSNDHSNSHNSHHHDHQHHTMRESPSMMGGPSVGPAVIHAADNRGGFQARSRQPFYRRPHRSFADQRSMANAAVHQMRQRNSSEALGPRPTADDVEGVVAASGHRLGRPGETIVLSGFPDAWDGKLLRLNVERFGKVLQADVNGEFGLVTFESAVSALDAAKVMHLFAWRGRVLRVAIPPGHEQGWPPMYRELLGEPLNDSDCDLRAGVDSNLCEDGGQKDGEETAEHPENSPRDEPDVPRRDPSRD